MTMKDKAILKAAKELAMLQDTWPSDGWDGAADARADHHRKVRTAEEALQTAYKMEDVEVPRTCPPDCDHKWNLECVMSHGGES